MKIMQTMIPGFLLILGTQETLRVVPLDIEETEAEEMIESFSSSFKDVELYFVPNEAA